MTVALCSAASGRHLELLDVAEPTFKRYAAEHGFDLIVDREPDSFGRPTSWHKINMLCDALGKVPRYDTAIWVDADALFVRFDKNILDVTDRDRPLWMTMHKVGGADHPLPNCGVLVAHRHDDLLAFLGNAWRKKHFIDHPWWEQAAILELLGYSIDRPGGLAHPGEPTQWTRLVGFMGTQWNSMPLHDPHPEPMIVHFSGMGFDQRLEGMKEAADASD